MMRNVRCDSVRMATTSGRCTIIAGWAIMIIRAGPGGRHAVFGSFAWSTLSHRCFPYGVRISSCPGSVARERSPLAPPNHTPVRSGWPACRSGGRPVCHHAPTGAGFGGASRSVAGGRLIAASALLRRHGRADGADGGDSGDERTEAPGHREAPALNVTAWCRARRRR